MRTDIPNADQVRALCAKLGYTAAPPLSDKQVHRMVCDKPDGIMAHCHHHHGHRMKRKPAACEHAWEVRQRDHDQMHAFCPLCGKWKEDL